LQIISQDEEKRMEYDARQKAILDYNQSMLEAEERGIQLGAYGIISFALDLNYSNEQILATLQKKLDITTSQADKYLEQYYSNNL
jgi:hypothetical protein